MPEQIDAWWARRQFSRGAEIPYAVGTYREAWAPYRTLIRQYHPDLNSGIALTQIPPAADVYLLWECEAGHRFVATPAEQRARPERERRRSSWCPDCRALAAPRRPAGIAAATGSPAGAGDAAAAGGAARPGRSGGTSRHASPGRRMCTRTPPLPPGEPFASECAPRPASAVEARLRADLLARLAVTPGCNAIRLNRPFFDHFEAWPDILLPELRVAIEYDSTGRHGLEHVGHREDADRRKDRAIRAAGWEVVRIRTGRLEKLGPFDLQVASVGKRALERVIDTLRDIRGPLLVDAYLHV
ncbi:MAG: zinc-ribbon domain-containing protein [Microbacterium sp.]